MNVIEGYCGRCRGAGCSFCDNTGGAEWSIYTLDDLDEISEKITQKMFRLSKMWWAMSDLERATKLKDSWWYLRDMLVDRVGCDTINDLEEQGLLG